MPAHSYRIKDPTLGIVDIDGRSSMLTVPVGSIVTVEHTAAESPLQRVEWDGRTMMMFTRDLRTRAELISFQAA
jgi:hypothetical protein